MAIQLLTIGGIQLKEGYLNSYSIACKQHNHYQINVVFKISEQNFDTELFDGSINCIQIKLPVAAGD